VTEVLRARALLCTAGGVVAALAVLAATRSPRTALPVLLDLLLAAGLLRLAAAPGWAALGTAAAVVAVRRTLARALLR
jgi:hypothetical protein